MAALGIMLAAGTWKAEAQFAGVPAAAEAATGSADSCLPLLATTPSLTGKPADWQGAVSIPVRTASYVGAHRRDRPWNGPRDAGLDASCGWTADGICIALNVTDDSVCNTNANTLQNLWMQDGVEVFADGRVGPKFMSVPYTKGAFQVFTAIDSSRNTPLFAVNKAHGDVSGIRMAAARTKAGYFLELIIPWSAFPDLKPAPGALVGLQFGLDDYDPVRDGATVQPVQITIQGRNDLSVDPRRLFRFVLTGPQPVDADTPLTLTAPIECPAVVLDGDVAFTVLAGASLAKQATRAELLCLTPAGSTRFAAKLRLRNERGARDGAKTASCTWRVGSLPDGNYTLAVAFRDKNGTPLGVSRRNVEVARALCEDARRQIDAAPLIFDGADIPHLAATQPGKALDWLAAAAALERTKEGLGARDPGRIRNGLSEWTARLGMLQNGVVPDSAAPRFRLLTLTANSDARVVLQYPAYRRTDLPNVGCFSFMYHGVPLVEGQAVEYASADEAAKGTASLPLKALDEPVTIDGKTGRMSSRDYSYTNITLNAAARLFLCYPARQTATELPAADGLAMLDKPAALVIGTGAPDSLAQDAAAWAARNGIPQTDLKAAFDQPNFVFVGDPAAPTNAPAQRLASRITKYRAVSVVDSGYTSFRVQQDRLIIQMRNPCKPALEIAARLVMKGQPVTAADVDAIRAEIRKTLPTNAVPDQKGMELFIGDLHVHTFYSDGSLTPEGMLLLALYNGMDFCAITDHNTIDGARTAARHFAQAGIAFPVIVGEEITTSWIHMNAYPLKTLISPLLSAYESTKAAHIQGAVIQWNHPGGYDRDWFAAHGKTGLVGTGFDAWEHVPRDYSQWKADGRLPTLIGSTDTHAGCFADMERTLVYAPGADGTDVAEAVRWGNTLILGAGGPEFCYGPDPMIARLAARLAADRNTLQAAMAARLAKILEKADIGTLIRASTGTPVHP